MVLQQTPPSGAKWNGSWGQAFCFSVKQCHSHISRTQSPPRSILRSIPTPTATTITGAISYFSRQLHPTSSPRRPSRLLHTSRDPGPPSVPGASRPPSQSLWRSAGILENLSANPTSTSLLAPTCCHLTPHLCPCQLRTAQIPKMLSSLSRAAVRLNCPAAPAAN